MRVLISTVSVPFIFGGAEVLAHTLLEACRKKGHEAEIVSIPFKHYPASRILDHMMACRLLDITEAAERKVDRVIGLKFPAYLIPHPKKSLWLLHQHRAAYDLWGQPLCDLMHTHNGSQIRDAIFNADNNTFKECSSSIYTISKNVSKRLKKFNAVDSTALYPPPQNADQFYCKPDQGYLFFPSRINPYKRQEFVIDALAFTKNPVHVVFGGKADQEQYGDSITRKVKDLGLSKRVTFLGNMSEEQKLKYYSESIGVVYTPVDEDYGYVTLEAMLASKPVITCTDSGGPLEFVRHRESGYITEPNLQELAKAMDELWENRATASKLGRAGKDLFNMMNINWDQVLTHLLA